MLPDMLWSLKLLELEERLDLMEERFEEGGKESGIAGFFHTRG